MMFVKKRKASNHAHSREYGRRSLVQKKNAIFFHIGK